MLAVVVRDDPEERGDVESTVGVVDAAAVPLGIREAIDDRDGVGTCGRVTGQDLRQRDAVETRFQAGFLPRPVRLLLLDDRGEAGPPDLALDGDQVTGDLGGTPFAGRHRLALDGRCGSGEDRREVAEGLEQLVSAHAPASSSTRFGASQRSASASGTPFRAA